MKRIRMVALAAAVVIGWTTSSGPARPVRGMLAEAGSAPTIDGGSAPHGAPAAPIAVWLTQPDGIRFPARPFGDGVTSGYETLDGFTVAQDAGHTWRYATDRGPNGPLALGSGRAEGAPPPIAPRHLRPVGAGADSSVISASARPNVGRQSSLVILVQFANRRSVGSTAADWSARFFGASDSVKDYYEEVSYGSFSLTPAKESHGEANDGVVGWLTLRGDHPNTRGVTAANQRLTRRALRAADPYVDFARYDDNGNGRIDVRELHVTVVVAGYETAYGGASAACAPSVWAHHSQFAASSAPTIDGKVVAGPGGGYTQFGEWHCTRGDAPGHLATIGPMVHEIGHDLGWPDLYDTDLSSKGVGKWSVMGTGSWNRVGADFIGSSPAHPDAFSKIYQGWVTPTRIVGQQFGVSVAAGATTADIKQLLANPKGVDWSYKAHSGAGEYYLVENRQKSGYDAGLPGCGLLIWHIDETRTPSNYANADETRKLVDLVEADDRRHLDRNVNGGDGGDPYPGSSQNALFGRKSAPNSLLYRGLASGVRVGLQSRTCAAVMVADFTAPDDGSNTSPTIGDISDQSTPVNTPEGPLAFTIGDAETDADRLIVSATSSDTTLVPNANITFGGAGAERTVTVTPASDQSGETTITVTVSDGSLTAQDSFVQIVTAVDPPAIAAAGQSPWEAPRAGAEVA